MKDAAYRKKTCRKAGELFVISAPSGSGKTTLCKKLLEDDLGLLDSVSATTRSPRPGESDGVDYHFVSRKKFQEMIEKNALLEYEENFGELYGTPREFVEENLKAGRSVLLSIDVKGAMKVKKKYPEKSVFIFILPPSMETLKKRLVGRMSEGKTSIRKRLEEAKKELSYKKKYDHCVVNDNLASAYRKLKNIILAELRKAE